MTIHKEGYPTIAITIVFLAVFNYLINLLLGDFEIAKIIGYILSAALMYIILQFFRSPKRNTVYNENHILSPADGRIVVIEEVEEPEYFKDKRIQVSVFMSPFNVHINHFPFSGLVKYVKYHKGLYLVAYHPKSSTENERSTVVLEHKNGKSVLFRQIAGALARRIVYYCKENDSAKQGEQFGFIKFGSRVDLFLPLGTKINVSLNQKVTGAETVIASW